MEQHVAGERKSPCMFSLSGCRPSGQYPNDGYRWLWALFQLGWRQESLWKADWLVQPHHPLAVAAQILFVLDRRTQVAQDWKLIVMSFSSLYLTIYRTHWGLKWCVLPLPDNYKFFLSGVELARLHKGLWVCFSLVSFPQLKLQCGHWQA